MNQLERLKPGTLLKIAHIKRDHLVQIIDKTQQEGLFYVDYYSSNDKDTWIPTKMHLDIMRMPHTIISKRELALEMIAKYYHSPEKCSIDPATQSCKYYDKETGKYCIVGMCMKTPEELNEDLNAAAIHAMVNNPHARSMLNLHPIILKVFMLNELRMMQAAHDLIAKVKDPSEKVYTLDRMFKNYAFEVENCMHIDCKAIERHIENNTPIWLPFHK